ncbi:uncharacterized protein LOC101845233 isoform X2 [Aplysia californica]|nr:uncharacterized protein LOC101845233 isoform X2 [Aplysia californica]
MDLEPDNVSKPQPKTARVDTEAEENVKKAEAQFGYPSSSWCHDVISEYKKHEREVSVSPTTSMNFSAAARVEAKPEEVNPAFEGSCEDLPATADSAQAVEKEGQTTACNSGPEKKGRGRDRNKRSPSPKKILRSGSVKKSPSRSGEQQLISREDADADDSQHAFSNPVMESEWSTFVGDGGQEAYSSPEPVAMVTTAPEGMSMERGAEPYCDSPYRGDQDYLLQHSESPSLRSTAAATSSTQLSHNWSEESTPDHNTHLLKGLQSPVRQSTALGHSSQYVVGLPLDLGGAPGESTDTDPSGGGEVEEVLRVEKEGENFVLTSEVQNKRDSSDLPKTGFDFLDDW